MKKILMVTVLAYFSNILLLKAQITENFSDGNFNSNPEWKGDSLEFAVINGQLQLNSAGSDSSYLLTEIPAISGNREWDFMLKLDFSPSSSNFCRVYLSSDQPNPEASLNGYFLQFGESGSNDAIELYKQNGFQLTLLGRGQQATLSSGFSVKIKVALDTNGNWEVFSNYNNGLIFTSEIQYQETNPIITNWFGWKCNYTSSNATKFYLDNVYSGAEILDTIPLSIQNIIIIDSTHLTLYFDEAVDSVSANNSSIFSIDKSIGIPLSSFRDSINPALIKLSLSKALINGNEYLLIINGLQDLAGNSINNYFSHFTYIKPEIAFPSDIIISEIMADPSDSPELPSVEYIEVYNRSSHYLTSDGWKISDGSSNGLISTDTIAPNDFRVYCSTAGLPLLEAAGIKNAKGVVSFPGLNNDGDEITIYDKNGITLDRVVYSNEFYHELLKSNGGWSMERTDLNFTCSNTLNWKASVDIRGGSPGILNSVNELFSDGISPYLIHATVIDSLHLRLHFSEAIDTVSAKNISNYTFENYSGNVISSFAEFPDFSSVRLSLSDAIVKQQIGIVSVKSSIGDCAGNPIKNFTSANFGLADILKPSDIIINEILFNPKENGSDFVELYNISKKIIDLNDLKISNADLLTYETENSVAVASDHHLIFPGHYIALTENINSIIANYKITDPRTLLTVNLSSYNDDEGIVRLFNSALELTDEFHYEDKMHFSLLNETEGISLERINPYSSSSLRDNWHSASQTSGFATPGYKNSQYFQSGESSSLLKIDPELFSPDNDGEKDITRFNIHCDKPGYYASLTIYNSTGIEQIKIAENELCGEKASWNWDGFTANKNAASIGIYLAFLRLVNADGTVKEEKLPFVLAHKL